MEASVENGWMSRIPRWIAGLLTLLAGLATTAPADALSCADPFHTLPALGSTAPRNTRVWVLDPSDQTSTYQWIETTSEQPVAFTVKRIPLEGPDLVVLTPNAPLAHPGHYLVESCGEHLMPPHCVSITEFRTVADSDQEAPALPVVRETGRHGEKDEWGEWRTVAFSIDGDVITVADVGGGGGESPLAENARLGAASSFDYMHLGEGPCTPATFPGERAKVRFGALDLAGNFSGYTEPVTVEKPEIDGCSVGSRQSGEWLLLLALALSVRRRLHSASMP